MRFTDLALMRYLKLKSPEYFAKTVELRSAVEGWLGYIPQSFPHYTRHTIAHSEEIILQISKMIFATNKGKWSNIPLNATEAYILAAAAYLHDAGMVVSDQEKTDILASDAWKSWTTGQGGGAKRLRGIEKLIPKSGKRNTAEREFSVNIQLRHLIAEFVRRVHHIRVRNVIIQHEARLGLFAFGDPELARAISDVCIAHGLSRAELEDSYRFPYSRDIRGEAVNLRFMAILLRIGDLLDVSQDRACPLLLNPACPLPPDSYAHWTMHQRFVHRLVSPERIEFTAECENQEEHRLLQDWFQWLVDEGRNAATLMPHAPAGQRWTPPTMSIDGPDPTIKITPSSKATYIPSRWVFELDQEVILHRLIHDVYSDPKTFLRELIQNALDATRCQLYLDLVARGAGLPESPTFVDEQVRRGYPLRISIRPLEVKNELSGERECRQVLVIDDCGTGMDEEVLRKYFLQVGRSFYTTEEFSRKFPFVPTSRFGVGFLSVFAASDHVVVETYKPSSESKPVPIKITLTGPRNYLLTEHGMRRTNGTAIHVMLRETWADGELTSLVRRWCPRVEFPIMIDDLSSSQTVEREKAEQFIGETPDITEAGAKFIIRAFPTNCPGIEGELYVLAKQDKRGESWAEWHYAKYRYPDKHPNAIIPNFPSELRCLHGISLSESRRNIYYATGPRAARLDFRSAAYQVTLSRQLSRFRNKDAPGSAELDRRWVELLREHLSSTPRSKSADGWEYMQKLMEYFPFESFWRDYPNTIRVLNKGKPKLLSLREVLQIPTLCVVIHQGSQTEVLSRTLEWAFLPECIETLSVLHRTAIFANRGLQSIRSSGERYAVAYWTRTETGRPTNEFAPLIFCVDLGMANKIGFALHKATDSVYETAVINSRNAFVKWLKRIRDRSEKSGGKLPAESFSRVLSLLDSPLRYHGLHIEKLETFLDAWRKDSNLDPKLSPPARHIEAHMFVAECSEKLGWHDHE